MFFPLEVAILSFHNNFSFSIVHKGVFFLLQSSLNFTTSLVYYCTLKITYCLSNLIILKVVIVNKKNSYCLTFLPNWNFIALYKKNVFLLEINKIQSRKQQGKIKHKQMKGGCFNILKEQINCFVPTVKTYYYSDFLVKCLFKQPPLPRVYFTQARVAKLYMNQNHTFQTHQRQNQNKIVLITTFDQLYVYQRWLAAL